MTDVWGKIALFFRRLFPPSEEEIAKMNEKQCTDPEDESTCKEVVQFVPFTPAERTKFFVLGGGGILLLVVLFIVAIASMRTKT